MMKRMIAALLATLLLLTVCAFAEGTDFASMTDEELHALVDGARNELANRELSATADTVLVDQDGVKVYLTGENRVSSSGTYLYLEAVVVNDSDKKVSVGVDTSSINGWDVYGGGIGETNSGKKQKGEFSFSLEDADISSYEELEDLEMELYLYDADAYERIGEIIPVVLNFKAE